VGVNKMKKGIKKGLIIGGAAIGISASIIGAGYLLAEKIIGPPDANENKVISETDKENQLAEQQYKEDQAREQAIQEATKEMEQNDISNIFKITSISTDPKIKQLYVRGIGVKGNMKEIYYPFSAFEDFKGGQDIKVGDEIEIGWSQQDHNNIHWDNIDYIMFK
jgi:hypothetical protein